MKIKIQTAYHSPRLEYAAKFLLEQILRYELSFGEDNQPKGEEEAMIIYYGTERPKEAQLFIPAHPFLQRSDLEQPKIKVKKTDDLPSFFHLANAENEDLSFDLFAMTFYLLSRFEEYDPLIKRDQHQRYLGKASFAAKHGFLNQPLIDQWAWRFYDLLKKHFPNCPDRKRVYKFSPTIDVDFAWAYLHKGWGRSTATFLKSLLYFNWTNAKRHLKVNLGQEKDPYDTYDFLKKIHKEHQLEALYFMLLGDYGEYDKNNRPEHPAMQQLIKEIAKKNDVGIHPSYCSNNSYTIFEKEKKRLEETLKKTISISRQHFLKLELPTTYRRLLKGGVEVDYSMGYAGATGFRASTAYPFYWYDLEREEVTTLQVVSFAVMDVTLKEYLALKPDEAIEACEKIINQTRETGGTFCLLWHNSSFSSEMGWEDWSGIYEKIVALAS